MIQALIIDDEALAVNNLQSVIENYIPEVGIAGTSNSIIEGAKLWKRVQPDVVFLDVEMEGGTGFDVWELSESSNTLVVMVTAHREYAIEAIKRGAFDYLLKPIDIHEVEVLAKKIGQQLGGIAESTKEARQTRLKLPVRDGFRLVEPESIQLLRAEKSYTEFLFTNESTLLVSKNIKSFESELAPYKIVRCHKSYCVNLSKVVEYSRTDGGRLILKNGTSIPVSKEKKAFILEKIGEFI